MQTIVNSAFAKFAVAFVAIAMAFSVVAPASAQNVDDMSLEELIALVTQLQGQLGDGGDDMMSSDAAVCPYTWTRSLNMGDTGADVMALQQFLNSMPETQVAASGAGSAGMETEYYGPATGAAVANFQMKYRAEILTPLGLVNPTTFFGNSTRAQANALCVAGDMMDDDDDMMDDDDDASDDDDDMDLSGEASLEDFEIEDANDDEIEEGEGSAVIAELTVEFTDGDAEISRLDIQIASTTDTSTNPDTVTIGDADPWDAFETVQLWIDGDMVAEEASDDEDDWLDEDDGIIRFSGLDIFAEEDEQVEILVAVDVMNGLDDEELSEWTVRADTMRFFDADGVATTEDNPAGNDEVANFTVEEAGAEDELDISTSSDDPDATTLVLDDEDTETFVVFAFELDTDDSTNDIEITEIVLRATTTGVTTGSADFEELVNGDDVRLLIGGDEITTDDVTVAGDALTFEFDSNDFVIDAEDEVTVEVEVEFDGLEAGNEGATFELSIDDTDVEAEGADDLSASQISGSATSEQHTVITEGIVILPEDVETSTDTQGDNDEIGVFEIDFDVTAYENDFYIGTSSVNFTVTGGATSSFSVTATADEETSDIFKVEEGNTETFTLKVNVTPNTNGDFRVTLDSVEFDDDPALGSPDTRVLTPETDFRTDFEFIQGA